MSGAIRSFSAGRAGAADSIFLRGVGNGRYVLGLDHWSVGSTESQPVTLAAGEVHTLVVESGSLAGAGNSGGLMPLDLGRSRCTQKQNYRFSRPNLKKSSMAWNAVGMFTSQSAFRGEIVSIRTPRTGGRTALSAEIEAAFLGHDPTQGAETSDLASA